LSYGRSGPILGLVRRLALLLALAAAAAPAAAMADGPSLGAAVASFDRTVEMHPAYRGALNAGRAETILARMVRAQGDSPLLVTCALTGPRSARCTMSVARGGAQWSGSGAVWQGKRHFVTSYSITGA
jgi:hypothetical protein